MDSDLAVVLGVVSIAFAFPAFLNAYSESRSPRLGIMLLILGGGFFVFGMGQSGTRLALNDVPGAFVRVIGRMTH